MSGPGKSRVLRLVWSNPNPPLQKSFDGVWIDECTTITQSEWDRWIEQTIPKKNVDWQSSLF